MLISYEKGVNELSLIFPTGAIIVDVLNDIHIISKKFLKETN